MLDGAVGVNGFEAGVSRKKLLLIKAVNQLRQLGAENHISLLRVDIVSDLAAAADAHDSGNSESGAPQGFVQELFVKVRRRRDAAAQRRKTPTLQWHKR